ncbi:hypothetical protein RYJ27_00645 [Microbacterium limosum]|uniref:Uncharacterized protein n=1 Tax=Microbacterium limosum TaxID=3079935 RepID=A0AAU0MHR6_9MICO|nr:hypothetical protein [Microbacterium sp. Y20]WOQ69793.1 hypothetical protein RYJ27_00645 [Microbacterium sp. Y20]
MSDPQAPFEREIRADIVRAERPDRPLRRLLRRLRAGVARHRALEAAYRVEAAPSSQGGRWGSPLRRAARQAFSSSYSSA